MSGVSTIQTLNQLCIVQSAAQDRYIDSTG